jgi:2,4-dienoyl-CoA reductase-like NADH-dependent reductase (Old Yellow Enzyme family)
VKLSEILKKKGVDLIDVSSGGLTSLQKIKLEPGFQIPFSEEIKNKVGIATGAVGLITKAMQAEEILQKNQADLIFFARESLRNPNLAITFAQDLGEDITWPKQYERAKIKSTN